MKALNEAGYQFRNHSPKGWFFAGKGAEPLEKSILEYMKTNSQRVQTRDDENVKRNKDTIHKKTDETMVDNAAYVKPNSPNSEINVKDYSKLMYEELKAIRGLLQKEEPKERIKITNDHSERISGLNQEAEKVQKNNCD
ncbi:hypothetical protein QUF79_00020 [Fictibacillus enclensis]|uniref:hypothetical protein n=1 Tax=Fictibacillus enclensis TaxID=1017270 RepID=UPI0025A28363|nr:hypothetical protein [Fictibacillus enclensis]MDM5196487.1 hypothetical protein [Fictibacillus enclensis]